MIIQLINWWIFCIQQLANLFNPYDLAVDFVHIPFKTIILNLVSLFQSLYFFGGPYCTHRTFSTVLSKMMVMGEGTLFF